MVAIGAAVGAKVMPPWPPGPASPAYVDEETRTTDRAAAVCGRALGEGWWASGRVPGKPPVAKPDVRAGERMLNLTMPSSYRPVAKGGATDDYRCFLLDPKLSEDAYATSASIAPGARSIVHHVILFRISATAAPEAKALDAVGRSRLVVFWRHRCRAPQQRRQRALDRRLGPGWGRSARRGRRRCRRAASS